MKRGQACQREATVIASLTHRAVDATCARAALEMATRPGVKPVPVRCISVIAEDAAVLLAGADAHLLAQCEAELCSRFLLKTHGRRQRCSTRCGDRVRAARSYARKRTQANPTLT